MIRAVGTLYPGIARNGKWVIINDIMKDRKYEVEIEFVDKKASRRSTNEASVIRAVLQAHRAILGMANPTDKISELKKIRKDTIASSCDISCFWIVNSNTRRR